MRHVLVETNWVVAYAAPAYQRVPAALELLRRAEKGGLKLYLPSISISEAPNPISQRYQIRNEADRIRQFLLWGKEEGIVDISGDHYTRRVLDQMETRVKNDLADLDKVLERLKKQEGLEVFPLDAEMLERCLALSYERLELKPFDQAILSAVLVRCERLAKDGEKDFAFCELDTDLQPWDGNGNRKHRLADLYDKAGIRVYGDFLLESPEGS
jgi:hypothetical protein